MCSQDWPIPSPRGECEQHLRESPFFITRFPTTVLPSAFSTYAKVDGRKYANILLDHVSDLVFTSVWHNLYLSLSLYICMYIRRSSTIAFKLRIPNDIAVTASKSCCMPRNTYRSL